MIRKLKDFYHKQRFNFDLYLSELCYRNRVGFKLNREGFLRWNQNRQHFVGEVSAQYPLGYHLFNVSNEDALGKMLSKYKSIITNPEYANIYDSQNQICAPEQGTFFMLKNIVDSIPEVFDLLTPDIVQLVNNYYGAHFHISHIAAYRTTHIQVSDDSKEVYAYRLHYDRHPVDTLKLFVNLSDVTIDDGALNFFDKKYSQMLLRCGYKERDNYGAAKDLINSDHNKIHLIGKPGTASLCNTTNCLHKAGIPKPGRTRDLLVISFESSPQELDLESEAVRDKIRKQIDTEYGYR